MKKSAHFDCTQCKQQGIIDPKIIIGGIVVLVVVFFIATGSFKFSASVKPNSNQPSNKQGQTTTQQPQTKPKTYQSEKYRFALEYPSSWSLKENPSPSYVAGFFSPEEFNSDNYKENILVRVVDVSTQPIITLQEAADLWENQTKEEEGNDFNVTNRKSATIDGEDAKDIEYTAKSEGEDIKGFARVILKNNNAYIFQYNALADTYDKYLPDIEAILTSVKF